MVSLIRIPALLALVAGIALLAASLARPATAVPQTVSVSVTDQPFAVVANPLVATGGTIRFDVINNGPFLPHNIVIVKTDLPAGGLPVGIDGFVREDLLNVIDKTEQLLVGEFATLEVDLAAGNYVLFCNDTAGHYTAGEYTAFYVLPPPTATPTPKPTATPKNPAEDTDGDTITNDIDTNDDNDGCTDVQELGDNPALGGQRNPHNFWDFFDVPTGAGLTRDGNIASLDIFQVLGRFNATDVGPGDFDRNTDPLTAPNPISQDDRANYHPAYDRGPFVGWQPWDLGPPDGSIAALDIFVVLSQFGHSCA